MIPRKDIPPDRKIRDGVEPLTTGNVVDRTVASRTEKCVNLSPSNR
jgi:hypothetical protein